MATPVPTSPITVKKRTTARRGLFQSDGDASDATTSSSEELALGGGGGGGGADDAAGAVGAVVRADEPARRGPRARRD